MSKSLKRVKLDLERLNIDTEILETGTAKTAALAAEAVGCTVDQIAKSIIFAGADSGQLYLFVTAGGQRVDPAKATTLVGEELIKANANTIRSVTGFAIGGVSPVGHVNPIAVFIDQTLMSFPMIYAAAGTPNHMFGVAPNTLASAIQAISEAFIE